MSLTLAVIVALWSVERISLTPPKLTPRSLEMATASTHVVIDTPTSLLVDLRQDTYSFVGLQNRAVLLGNVIASAPVRQRVARRLGIAVERLVIQPPLTPRQTAPPVDSENARRTGDILASADQYRLNVKANPTVPVLEIFAQTPTANSAATLANAAVEELQVYLAGLAAREGIDEPNQINLIQLGRARGTVINAGIAWQVALLAFLLTAGAGCSTVVLLSRIRDGWRLAASAENPAPAER